MKYGKTEQEVEVEKTVQCRQIVEEILNFGVDELQKRKIIYLLSLELEDRETMVQISKIINNDRQNKPDNELIKID
jgi:hypothetical protein|tara:strand:+ start:6622 stop:6849 length:228 start_codon:yes stop_codon:yes gene_type:complete